MEHLRCSQLQLLNVGKSATYTSMQTISDFLKVVPDCIEEDVLSKLEGHESFTLMADESTSIAVMKELILCARAVNERAELTTYFFYNSGSSRWQSYNNNRSNREVLR